MVTYILKEIILIDSEKDLTIFFDFQIAYGITTPQLNFIRILSNHVWQEIILQCVHPVRHYDDIQLIGWNKKIFNAADKNRVQITKNTCHKVGFFSIFGYVKRNLVFKIS